MLALLGVFQSRIEGALRKPDGKSCNRNSSAVQDAQAIYKPFARFSEELRLIEAAIRKQHLACGASPHTKLVFLLADLEPRCIALENESGDTMLRSGPVRNRHRYAHIGVVRISSESLSAI